MGERLTAGQVEMLLVASDCGFWGLRPGDNMWPLIEYVDAEETASPAPPIDGEEVDHLVRRGLLLCDERRDGFLTLDATDDMPDVECRWRYDITDAGRAALAGGGGNG